MSTTSCETAKRCGCGGQHVPIIAQIIPSASLSTLSRTPHFARLSRVALNYPYREFDRHIRLSLRAPASPLTRSLLARLSPFGPHTNRVRALRRACSVPRTPSPNQDGFVSSILKRSGNINFIGIFILNFRATSHSKPLQVSSVLRTFTKNEREISEEWQEKRILNFAKEKSGEAKETGDVLSDLRKSKSAS